MKTTATLFTFLVFGLFTTIKAQHNLVINIDSWGSDSIYIVKSLMSNPQQEIFETLFAKDGIIVYDISADEGACIATFVPKKATTLKKNGRPIMGNAMAISKVVIKPENKIKIDAKVIDGNYLDYEVEGSVVNKIFAKERIIYQDLDIKIDSLNYCIENVNSNEEREPLFAERKKVSLTLGKLKDEYIENNLDKVGTPHFELAFMYLAESPNLFMKYRERLSNAMVSESTFAPVLQMWANLIDLQEAIIANKGKIKEGEIAPDFTLRKPDGDEFTLSSLRGKTVVLYFWGSWCAPCIQGFPKLKESYEKFKENVEFVGVNCNETDKAWRSAIEKYDLKWTHVINEKAVDKNLMAKYSIDTFPTKIIIDKDGEIVGTFIGSKNDFYEKIDEFAQ